MEEAKEVVGTVVTDKARLLELDDRERKTKKIWGARLTLQAPNAAAIFRLERMKDDLSAFSRELIRIGVVDPVSGEPFFTEEEIHQLYETKSSKSVAELVNDLNEMAGNVEEAEKN